MMVLNIPDNLNLVDSFSKYFKFLESISNNSWHHVFLLFLISNQSATIGGFMYFYCFLSLNKDFS